MYEIVTRNTYMGYKLLSNQIVNLDSGFNALIFPNAISFYFFCCFFAFFIGCMQQQITAHSFEVQQKKNLNRRFKSVPITNIQIS